MDVPDGIFSHILLQRAVHSVSLQAVAVEQGGGDPPARVAKSPETTEAYRSKWRRCG